MTFRTHELHAATVHAPLVLLPAAALVDLLGSRPGLRHRPIRRLGKTLWWFAAGSGLMAGAAGLAASREVRVRDRHVEDRMWLHGATNLALVMGAFGMAAWRRNHRPTLTQSLLGLTAVGIAGFGAYLGGELVYTHGVGVEAMSTRAPQGVGNSPPLLSRQAPATLLRDALKGALWLLTRPRSPSTSPTTSPSTNSHAPNFDPRFPAY